jgi:hypothetical protein
MASPQPTSYVPQSPGFRHRTVALGKVAVGRLVAACTRDQRPKMQRTDPNQGLNDYIVDLSCRHLSGVAGCFLDELHT